MSAKILFNFTFTTSDYLDTNATAEGRARNRSARVTFVQAPPRGTDPCDLLTVARTLDEYLFLVRCLETRLGLAAPADARTALSVLRQVYFGSGAWSLSRNAIWDAVITGHPWAPGTDPAAALRPPLVAALRASQVVEGSDIGHVLTGLDAMLAPATVVVRRGPVGLDTGLANEEWATWAGDVGSAAAEWASAAWRVFGPPLPFATFFTRFAGDSDLVGDLDAFALRAGVGGGTPPASLMRPLVLSSSLSELLLQYSPSTRTGPAATATTARPPSPTAWSPTPPAPCPTA